MAGRMGREALRHLLRTLGQLGPKWHRRPGTSLGTSAFHRGTGQSFWEDSQGYKHFGQRKERFSTRLNLYVLGGLGAGCFGIYWSHRETIPYTQRRHAIFISEKKEQAIGEAAFFQVKKEAIANKTLLPQYHPVVQKIRGIGLQIAEAAADGYGGGKWSHMENLEWEFIVIDSPEPNAFVVPGGKVVFYTGLLKILKSYDEVAAVLGHEVAHVVARHALFRADNRMALQAERISEMGVLFLLKTLVYVLVGFPFPAELGIFAVQLPHSRRAETEADAIGLRIMARACFDPSSALGMLQKLQQLERKLPGASVPTLLRTHPITSDRIKNVKDQMREAEQLYYDRNCSVARGLLRAFSSLS